MVSAQGAPREDSLCGLRYSFCTPPRVGSGPQRLEKSARSDSPHVAGVERRNSKNDYDWHIVLLKPNHRGTQVQLGLDRTSSETPPVPEQRFGRSTANQSKCPLTDLQKNPLGQSFTASGLRISILESLPLLSSATGWQARPTPRRARLPSPTRT